MRTWLLWYADETGFYLTSITGKEVVRQLDTSPKVELCFFNYAPNPPDWKQMRVTGKVEFLHSEEMLAKAYQARSFLDPFVAYSVEPIVRPFRVCDGEARFWTLADFLKESEVDPIKF